MAGDKMSVKISVLALGGAGCRIIREFAGDPASANFNILAMDSDLESLKNSGVPEDRWIQAGKLLRSGRGCGGDVIAGQQVVANERKLLTSMLADTHLLIVTGGLGGGLATGGLSVVLGVAAKLRIASAVVATLPFDMEGFQRRRLADDKLKNDILPVADAVIALPNDLLFSTLEAETPMSEAFQLADKEMAKTLFAVASILGGGNLFSADFAAFTGVLKRRHTLCALGSGVADYQDDAPEKAMQAMLMSPLLGGPETLDTADALAFSLLGGPELSMGTARSALELCARQLDPKNEKNILLGASTSEDFAGKLQLSVLAVRYLDPLDLKSPRKNSSRRIQESGVVDEPGTQMDLPNLIVEDKGIMENTLPVMLNGEDLDIPAFKRRGIVIDAGK